MAVCGIANNPHIDPVTIANVLLDNVRLGRVKVLRSAPASRVADVLVGRVGSIAILVDQIPEALRLKEENLRGGTVAFADRSLVQIVKLCIACFFNIREGQVNEIVAGLLGCAGKNVIRAIYLYRIRRYIINIKVVFSIYFI